MIGLVFDFEDIIAVLGIQLDANDWCIVPHCDHLVHQDILATEITMRWLIFGFTYFKYVFEEQEI